MDEIKVAEYFQKVRIACGVVVLFIGTIASLSWLVDFPALSRISDRYIPVAQDTGLAFVVMGIILLAHRSDKFQTPARFGLLTLSSVIGVYGLLKVLGQLTGMDLTYTQTLFPANEHFGVNRLNRMSPITGAMFFLTSLGLTALLTAKSRNWQRSTSGWIGLAIFGAASLMTYGYLLGAPFFYYGKVVPVAFLTSIGFCLLGVGLVVASGPDSILKPFFEQSTKSRILRVYVPLVVLTCFLQQTIHELSSATEINRTLLLILTPLAAAIAAAIAGNRLAEYLSKRLNAANQLLEESEEKYRTAVEHSHDMFWTLDLTGNFLFANKRCTEVSGYEVSELIGRNFTELLSQKSKGPVYAIFLKVLNGEPQQLEVEAIKADGSLFYVEISSVPDYKSGQIVGASSFGRDITNRKQVEQALSRSEALLRESQSVARIGSYDLDIVSRTWTSSLVLDEIMGIDANYPRNIEGWVSMVHPEWQDTMARYLEIEVIGKRQRFNKEYRLVRKNDGKECWVHGLGKLTLDELGNPVRLIGTIQDITERKNAETEREDLESKLRQARKLETIGTLAGGVAHDFNNILTPILVYSDMAALELGAEHPLHSDLEHIIAGANRAKDLVKQILTFSRQMDNERIPVNLKLVVKEAIKLIQVSLPHNITVQTSIQGDSLEILGDPSQIHQVILNLCTNAHHAMRTNGGTLRVELNSVTLSTEDVVAFPKLNAGEFVRLSVSDDGCGMNESTRDRIFEPFFTTKAVGEGTGLGLSVVHGIIKSHDGAIAVKSTLNKGTSFEIYLPKLQSEHEVERESSSKVAGGNESILLVDDDPDVAEVIRSALERLMGYQVTVSTSSLAALEMVRRRPAGFDLVITDQKMPALTGVQLAQQVSSIRKDLPVILMTGFSDTVDEAICREMGIAAFLLKPPDTVELAKTLRKVLDLSKHGAAVANT